MHDKRIKVLQIVGNARLGGVASCLLNYYRRTDSSLFRFDFVTYSPSEFDRKISGVDPYARIFYISPFQKNFLKGISQLEKILKKEEYPIVHSHLTTLSAFSLTAAAHAGVPVRICHAHSAFNKSSDHFLIKSFLKPFAAEHATHLMACSRHAAENIFGKRADEAVILPDAIEAEKFYSSERDYFSARKKLGLSGKIVLFVGRFAYQKNIPFLVSAFAKASKNNDMTLVLIGEGEAYEAITSAVNKFSISDKVRLIEPCDPVEWYKAADLFCLPSRYEGLGMAAIEAQAAGLKCLLSQSVPKETDITGNCIFLPDDADAWAQALLSDYTHYYDCREDFLKSHYDIAQEAGRLTEFYRSVLKESE